MIRTFLSLLLLPFALQGLAQGNIFPPLTPPPDDTVHPYFPDVILWDQDGNDQRLYTDLMRGKIVIINSFFASCEGVCPVLAKNLVAIQTWLGDRMGKDVHILSLTVDPEKDTPPILQAYAQRFKAKPGWFFLSGKIENVHAAAKKLGQYVPQKEGHTNVIVIGNETTGLWKKVQGMAPAQEIIKVLETVVNDKG